MAKGGRPDPGTWRHAGTWHGPGAPPGPKRGIDPSISVDRVMGTHIGRVIPNLNQMSKRW